ncbi:MAG: hypothetical protein HUJ57_04880 [Erysipelotrichaceae bacterium]|nr:hypothetical protein [Erysipelotrichaceae bacterium]
MKKLICLGTALLLLLTGCSDAHASMKSAADPLMSVGKTTITKGDVYNFLKKSASGMIIQDALDKIVEAEVEVTPEMEESARSTETLYKTMYGDAYEDMVKAYGYEDAEDFYNRALLASAKENELIKKYVKENLETVATEYAPKKAIVMDFNTVDDADLAKTELDAGSEPAKVLVNYESTASGAEEIVTAQSGYPSEVLAVLNSISADDGYAKIAGSDGKVYLIKLISSDVNDFADEFVESIYQTGTFSTDAVAHYLKKYNFSIHDRETYDALKTAYPDFIK